MSTSGTHTQSSYELAESSLWVANELVSSWGRVSVCGSDITLTPTILTIGNGMVKSIVEVAISAVDLYLTEMVVSHIDDSIGKIRHLFGRLNGLFSELAMQLLAEADLQDVLLSSVRRQMDRCELYLDLFMKKRAAAKASS